MYDSQRRGELIHLNSHVQLNMSETSVWARYVPVSGDTAGSRADETPHTQGAYVFVVGRDHNQTNETH